VNRAFTEMEQFPELDTSEIGEFRNRLSECSEIDFRFCSFNTFLSKFFIYFLVFMLIFFSIFMFLFQIVINFNL